MISIQKNPVIKLDIPHFLCDADAVGKHLKEHPLTELLNVYGFLCVIGRPGSGKTSMTISLMTQSKPKIYKKTHHHMIILMPANSIGSLKKNPFSVLPSENIYHELTDKSIQEIYNKIDGYSEKDEKTLLFIDDIPNLILFKPSKKEMELVFDELFETKKDIFLDIMRMAFDEKHNFLFLNIPTQRLFKNFDEIVIQDDII